MKIALITPGSISIPPNGWGAVEKILHNYRIHLESLGHHVDIKLPNDINKDEYDLVSVHMSNQAHMLHERDIPYIMHMHDHHSMIHDNVFQDNKLALKNALIGIVPAEYLLTRFNLPNVIYLEHGVDTNYFIFKKHDTPHKLLCVANNGLLGHLTFDRKGFCKAISAARELNLPITIAGPRNNNELFFNENSDLLDYDKLNIMYDLNEQELLDVYHDHTIFLHPSTLEAGHPNLSILEAISCGLPVVGTYQGSLPILSLYKIDENDNSINSLTSGIKNVISNYEHYQSNARYDASNFDWRVIVKKLELLYRDAPFRSTIELPKRTMREELIEVYSNIKRNDNNVRTSIDVSFNDGACVNVTNLGNEQYHVEFWDKNDLVYQDNISNGWCMPAKKWYTEWKIKVNDKEYNLDLNNKEVLIICESPSLGDNVAWLPYIDEFQMKHNCKLTYASNWGSLFEDNYTNIKFVPYNYSQENFYATYKIGIFDDETGLRERHPINWKTVPLQKVVCDILGLEYKEKRPKIVVHDTGRPINDKYVVLTEHSTLQAKYWNRPNGWQEIVDYLNEMNYKVIVISKEPTKLKNIIDRTNHSIHDTINTIYHSEFGLGTSTGVGWISWALGKPWIIPSGFSEIWSEYVNIDRIMTPNTCNGCFNDINIPFNRGDWNWCPRSKSFECSSLISPDDVKLFINRYIK